MRSKRHLTKKQRELMRLIVTGNTDGNNRWVSWLDLEQLHDRLSYHCTRQAVSCSIRFLEEKGLVVRGTTEKRRGAHRVLLVPTEAGLDKISSAGYGETRIREYDGVVEYY